MSLLDLWMNIWQKEIKNSVKIVEVMMPPMETMTIGARVSEPLPMPSASGKFTMVKTQLTGSGDVNDKVAGVFMPNEILAKSILNKHKKRDSWFLDDYSINPYMGCSVNCLYCYIRGSDYGKDMKVSVKTNAPEILDRQLARRAKKGEYGIIAVASATDAYMPVEEELGLTRQCLLKILKYRFPVHLITKSSLVLRDLDILKQIDLQAIHAEDLRRELSRGVILATSISTLDPVLARRLEPAAPSPLQRLETVARCKEAGFFVGVYFIPTLPYISDTDEHVEAMIHAAQEHNIDFVLVGGLTLFGSEPADSKTLVYKILERDYPELISKYNSLYRGHYGPPFSYQKQLERRVRIICKKYGVQYGILGR